jgi:hypothetical protein
MSDDEETRAASAITVGDVQGTGIVIGNRSSAVVNNSPSSLQQGAAAMLDEFIRLLEAHQSSVPDASGVQESATAARRELSDRSPRWPVVRGLLRGVAAGVTGVSALADIIDKIQALIAHMPA